MRETETGPKSIIEELARVPISILPEPRRSICIERWKLAIAAGDIAGRPSPILKKVACEETALFVIDMQRGFLDPGAATEVPAGKSIIANINMLTSEMRKRGGAVVFFRYVVTEDVGLLPLFEGKSYLSPERESPMKAFLPDHEQCEITPDLHIHEGDLIIDKTRYSALEGSAIEDVLRSRSIKNVIVTGVTSDVCVGNTAEGLMQRDYHVVVVWDGSAALDRLEHEIYLARIYGLYADVMTTREVLARLT